MKFDEFYAKYKLRLNTQQKEAVQAVDGPVLLLAVPGSGKTTVLVSRLGYMVYCLGIRPENILTLTYTVAATKDMERRFRSFFDEQSSPYTALSARVEPGDDSTKYSKPDIDDFYGSGNHILAENYMDSFRQESSVVDRLQFRTINGICASIISHYGRMIGKEPFKLITDEKSTSGLLASIYKKIEGGFATESDLQTIRTQIAYIKNMMLEKDEIQDLNEDLGMNIADIYREYNQELKKAGYMDYDDQMIYAYTLLRKIPGLLDIYQEKFRYILVDEAQDTSKIQHAIIALLASKYNNLFMVGDEDQSIYGFRAAYPEALLSFEKQHPGAKVLLMEENFRSNARIVEAADRFIQKNTLRHEKHMRPTREVGAPIQELEMKGRISQYRYLVKVAHTSNEEGQQTVVLYRDNENVLPLVDLLERQNIPYRMRSGDLTFFSHRIVRDIVNVIRFAQNPSDADLFLQIYYKLSTYLSKQKALEACEVSQRENISILDAAIRFGHLPGMTIGSLRSIQTHLKSMLTDQADYAITRIVQHMGYGEYLDRMKLKDNKIFILKALAKQEPDPILFVEHLEQLATTIREKENDYNCPFILSTIHGSKGLEYDNVYLLDVADGIFPENLPTNLRRASREEIETYEEERRLFYVGVTRAKDKLFIFKTGRESTFRKELMAAGTVGVDSRNANTNRGANSAGYKSGIDSAMRRSKYVNAENSDYIDAKMGNVSSLSLKKQEKVKKSDQYYKQYLNQLGEGLFVVHKKYGRGAIMELSDDKITIMFDDKPRTLDLKICFKSRLLEIE
ncbi:MAG: ATP-dependent helicase [Dorea sp.]|nr:ATP-dependent helicase [Dorea sp.]